jgi:hypothetical protein
MRLPVLPADSYLLPASLLSYLVGRVPLGCSYVWQQVLEWVKRPEVAIAFGVRLLYASGFARSHVFVLAHCVHS